MHPPSCCIVFSHFHAIVAQYFSITDQLVALHLEPPSFSLIPSINLTTSYRMVHLLLQLIVAMNVVVVAKHMEHMMARVDTLLATAHDILDVVDSNHNSFENHIVDYFHMKNYFAFLKRFSVKEIS